MKFTGWSRKNYPSKILKKKLPGGQCITDRLNLRMAAFCFGYESGTGFHRSAWTPHHFFVQLGQNWFNGCIQSLKIVVGMSWNTPLQNRPDIKVHEIDIKTWGWPHLLVQKASEINLAPFLGHNRCVSWNTLCDDIIILKWFCEPRKSFFLQKLKKKTWLLT